MSIRKHRNGLSRRQILASSLGAAALASVAGPLRPLFAEDGETVATVPGGGKAKQVVILYMSGGASHLDTFDPKPGTPTGGTTKAIPTAVDGIRIADSMPKLAGMMKDICLVRGMSSKEGNHERARYLLHTGYAPNPTVVHPGLGSIISHELADQEAALPNYVCVNGPGARPGYLGVNHAPFVLRVQGEGDMARGNQGNAQARRGRRGPQKRPVVPNLAAPRGVETERRDDRLDFLSKLNEGCSQERGTGATGAQAAMFERARRLMDSPKNTAFDLAQETAETQARYGKHQFGKGCLMARRLLSEGVACVEVTMGGWDTHDDNFTKVAALSAEVDQGASALLSDLKANGKLDETLVIWVGDFGRTPRITASQGRGHYPRAWSMWLAGGGIQGGKVIGATDPSGSEVVEGVVSVPDLFRSLAHATGFDGEKVFYSNGRPINLVFEEGKVVPAMFTA
jgi:hypothetical protein